MQPLTENAPRVIFNIILLAKLLILFTQLQAFQALVNYVISIPRDVNLS